MITEPEVWMRAWCAAAVTTNIGTPERATYWADECAKAWRERFDKPINSTEKEKGTNEVK